MADDAEQVHELSLFLLDYASALLGAGVHTARAVRNLARIAEAYGFRIDVSVSQRNVMMSIASRRDASIRRTSVRSLQPLHFDFSRIRLLSALTWRAWDDRVPLRELVSEFHHIMAQPRLSLWGVLVFVSLANAAFCRLFGGDFVAMGVVFVATVGGFMVRHLLARHGYNHLAVTILAAFAASMIASLATTFHWGATPDTALAASVLFLVPGFQVINAVMDLVGGHILNGIQRAAMAGMLIICMAVGLSCTMMMLGLGGMR